jgi:hypothetical protein
MTRKADVPVGWIESGDFLPATYADPVLHGASIIGITIRVNNGVICPSLFRPTMASARREPSLPEGAAFFRMAGDVRERSHFRLEFIHRASVLRPEPMG